MWIGVVGALLLVASCSSSDDAAEPDVEGPVVGVSSQAPTLLRAPENCDDLVEGFRRIASDSMTAALFGMGVADEMAVASSAPAADTAASGAESAASSDTNTQEEGIDEPDIVETDGEHVYTIDSTGATERLVILDAASAQVVGRLDLGTWGNTMMLSGDRLMVISGGGYVTYAAQGPAGVAVDTAFPAPAEDVETLPAQPAPDEPGVDPVPVDPVPVEPLPIDPPNFDVGTTITLIDVADPTAPAVVQATEFEGVHNTTRVVDGVARVVLTAYPAMSIANAAIPVDVDDEEAFDDAVESAELSDWLPQYRTVAATDDGEVTVVGEGDAVECGQVLLPDVNAGTAETSILRVDFENGFDPSATTTVVADAGSVYASSQTLYIAATRWVAPDAVGDDWETAIHSFDLTGPGAAVHAAAGSVPGSLLNQYSMSEHDGLLRVATTEGTPWTEQPDSQSGVRVLRAVGDTFEEVGSVTGLGVTETIQSVRFMGDVAYVVTFRQTDPLYVIDLADPTAPRAVGELKIPGFSSYLHPIGDDLLVGVGRNADAEGTDTGFLVSVFDVSDPSAPTQIDTFTDPDMFSAAGNDPKAFLWWAEEGTVVVPYERYSSVIAPLPADTPVSAEEPAVVGNDSGLLVLDVSAAGISERGTVTTGDSTQHTTWTRGLVVRGDLWGTYTQFSGDTPSAGVAVTSFGSLDEVTLHPFG